MYSVDITPKQMSYDCKNVLRYVFSAGVEEDRRNNILSALQSSSSKECDILPDANLDNLMLKCEHGISANSGQILLHFGSDHKERVRNCSFCSPDCHSVDNTCAPSVDDSSANSDKFNSMAIVPVENPEGSFKSLSLSTNKSPGLKPGWPLLCRAISTHWETGRSLLLPSVSQISVVQWAMRLPSRSCASSFDFSEKQGYFHCDDGPSSELNGENGAIVPAGNGIPVASSSPITATRSLPEELDGLHEKYSATCRLFQYNELLSATSQFIPGLLLPLSHTFT